MQDQVRLIKIRKMSLDSRASFLDREQEYAKEYSLFYALCMPVECDIVRKRRAKLSADKE